ncbi:MAG: DDE-type integrase/transposase/recombinase [Candidatus Thiodiazotropha taylori]|nr:DDE-type integrase/transposase/recombinase [Candidatus Thiodiazotropha taylori]
MPFGLCNAPASFQRLMERCMGELNLRDCLIYLDDIIIFSSTFEEHVERLQAVFERLQEHNLKLKPSKCKLFRRKVTYLGHVVSEEGIHTDPSKIDAIKTWPVPKSTKDVRRFLGFTGYYRRFIKRFAAIVRPLNDLLVGHTTNPKAKKKKALNRVPFKWETKHQTSFETVIDRLTHPPVLAYADYKLPFKVHTDASFDGLGAVLYQCQDEKDRVIAYASRSLKPSEKNYPAHKLEFLALKWAVCEKFHDYLYGAQFEVITDNNPLTYVLTTAKLDATGQRWVASLSGYNFSIKYRSGKKNADADGLSRRREIEEQRVIFPETLKAVSHSMSIMVQDCPLIESVAVSDTPVTSQEEDIPEQLLMTYGLTAKDWRKAQLNDPCISFILNEVQTGSKVPARRNLHQAVDARYLREWEKVFVVQGVLHRKVSLNGQDFQQIVLPPVFREEVFQALHDDLGNKRRDRTTSLIKQRFFGPGKDIFVRERVKSCGRCIRRKTGGGRNAALVNIKSSSPMEIVCLDYLSLERSKGGYESILVITDHFSRYAQAIPTMNQTAKTTARVLFDNFVVHYGFPARIHSDQGANFESQLIKELCQIAKVEKSRTTPYHPMGNGQVERFNQTLLQMLGTLEEYQKSDWKAHIPTLVHAYNATFHDSTGYSPFFLMFGRHPRLAIDAFLGLTPDSLSGTCHSDYIRKLRDRLNFAYKKAEEEAKQSAAVHKKHYDSNVRNSVLQPGDLVLVRRVGIKGKNKLGDRWEQDPYIIVEQPNGDIPVYAVKRQNNRSKKIRLLHRSLLLPFMGLPRLEEELEADDEVTVNESAGQRSDVMDNPSADLPCSDTSVVFFEDKDGTATETGLSVDSDSDDQKPGKYKIPMLRKAGESGLLPRSSGSSHSRSSSVSESSSDEGDSTPKLTRARRKPHWMKSDDWLVGQQHTFYVDPDQVVHL